jgi:hypothetical protein
MLASPLRCKPPRSQPHRPTHPNHPTNRPPPPAQAHPNSIALFVPTEVTTYCFYPGTHKDFLVANAIFRMGGAAMLMTNKPSLYSRCKYELQHADRVHTGQDDTSYK